MKRMTGITVLCLALMGCSSVTSENGTQYLKTEMQSSVSGPTTVTVTADSLLKKANTGRRRQRERMAVFAAPEHAARPGNVCGK